MPSNRTLKAFSGRGGNESGQDREASAADINSVSKDGESKSEETASERETSEAEAAVLIV